MRARGRRKSSSGTGFGTRHAATAYGTSFDLNGKNEYRITVYTVFVTSARNAVVRGCHAHGRARMKTAPSVAIREPACCTTLGGR